MTRKGIGRDAGKVAIIGANGRIGPALTRYLAETKRLEVVAVCRSSLGADVLSHIDCEKRIGSMADPVSAKRLIGDCKIAVNCAFDRGLPRSSKIANKNIVRNIVNAKNLSHIVLLSTVAVYGTLIYAENQYFDSPRPDTPYGKLKRALERYAHKMLLQSDKSFNILRTGHVYGPYQWLSKYILETVRSGKFALPFTGRASSNAIHIENISHGIGELIASSLQSGIYNFTDYPQKSWREIYDWHTELLKVPAVPAMNDNESNLQLGKYMEIYRRSVWSRAALDILSWLKNMPTQNSGQLNSLRGLIYEMLGYVPSPVEKGIKSIYNRLVSKGSAPQLSEEIWVTHPLFFCLEVPGPCVTIGKLSDSILRRSEKEWKDWTKELG